MSFYGRRRLALTHGGRFFVKFPTAYFGQNTGLFARAPEPANGDIKGFILFYADTGHICVFNSSLLSGYVRIKRFEIIVALRINAKAYEAYS